MSSLSKAPHEGLLIKVPLSKEALEPLIRGFLLRALIEPLIKGPGALNKGLPLSKGSLLRAAAGLGFLYLCVHYFCFRPERASGHHGPLLRTPFLEPLTKGPIRALEYTNGSY